MLILYVISLAVGILWFIDEILSFRNLEHLSLNYNKPPMIAWFLHHHAKGIIYLKLATYVFFVYLAAEIFRKYYEFFHIFVLILICFYLFQDIKIQRKLF